MQKQARLQFAQPNVSSSEADPLFRHTDPSYFSKELDYNVNER